MEGEDLRDTRDIEDYIRDLSKILLIGDLHPHTRRSILYKAIRDFSERQKNDARYQNWSRAAWAACEQAGCWRRKGLVFEHAVPISLITGELTPAQWVNPATSEALAEWNRKLDYAFRRLVVVCWLTDEEDRRLNKQFKNKMPAGKDLKWSGDNVWARYEGLSAEDGRPQEIELKRGTHAPPWPACGTMLAGVRALPWRADPFIG